MALTIGDFGGRTFTALPPPPPVPAQKPAIQAPVSRAPEPAYHPQVAPPGTCGAGPAAPYDAANFSQYVSGTQPRQVDVDLMRMSLATYETGEQNICGWTALTGEQLEAAGMDPGRLDVPDSQFSARVFTDGQGNYVLAFRGTQEGGADWMTNFAQGAGQQTDEFDRLAPQAAQEFAQAFGERGVDAQGNPTYSNLVITGHSQGGGLATIASAVTGIPAVTFDPSGIHDRTFERLGLDGSQFRQDAESGQVRRYSTQEDAVTQVQEGWFTAAAAPDAIGHQVVVRPEGDLANHVVQYGMERLGLDPALAGAVNGLVEHGLPALLGPLGGAVRYLARAGSSHEQQLMIDTMLQQQPWQPGYQNPASVERTLMSPFNSAEVESRVTEAVATGVDETLSDLAQGQADIAHIRATDGAAGRNVQAEWSIAGEYAQTGLDIVGDIASTGADVVGGTIAGMTTDTANTLDARADAASNPVERFLLAASADGTRVTGAAASTLVQGAGDVVQAGFDAAGVIADKGSDVVGAIDQGVTDAWNWLGSKF